MVITMSKEFEEFKKHFNIWFDKFGLSDWKILYFQEMPYEPDCPYARVSYKPNQHEVWVYFWGSNGTQKFNTNEKAFHEVCHLLLADLCSLSNADTDMEEHTIINRLIAAFLE